MMLFVCELLLQEMPGALLFWSKHHVLQLLPKKGILLHHSTSTPQAVVGLAVACTALLCRCGHSMMWGSGGPALRAVMMLALVWLRFGLIVSKSPFLVHLGLLFVGTVLQHCPSSFLMAKMM